MQSTDALAAQRPTDGLLKRLYWPRIVSQYDVDLVGQQGFWICMIVATAWMVGGFFTARPYLDALIGLTYVMAAMGVRQHSVPAAILAFLCLFLDRVASLEALLLHVPGGGNPMIGMMATLLLFLNIRATLLAHRWQMEEGESVALAESASLLGRFVNYWPRIVWPRARYVFYALAGLMILMSVAALFSLPSMHREQMRQGSSASVDARR
jgi:hypothetical protein